MNENKIYPTCSEDVYSPMTKLTAEWFGSKTQCESTISIINAFRETGKQKTKSQLPVCCFQAMFDTSINKKGIEGTWRENLYSHLTGLVMMDIDHLEVDPQTLIDKWLSREDFKELGILLIYISPSGKGIKVVFIARPEWGNLIDNQFEMAQLLGVKIDLGCKDAARASFIPKADDVKYLDERLFTYSNPEYDEQYGSLYRRKPAKSGPTQKKWREYEKQLRGKGEKPQKAESEESSVLYHGVAYSKIADELVKLSRSEARKKWNAR